jgi:hypothetical protein
MRKLLSVFGVLSLCLVFTGCDKDEELTSASIVGPWEVTHYYHYAYYEGTYTDDGPYEDFDYNANKEVHYMIKKGGWDHYNFNIDGTIDNYQYRGGDDGVLLYRGIGIYTLSNGILKIRFAGETEEEPMTLVLDFTDKSMVISDGAGVSPDDSMIEVIFHSLTKRNSLPAEVTADNVTELSAEDW